MSFFNRKNNIQTVNSPDLEHLTQEGELPVGWYYQYKEFTEGINAKMSFFLNQYLDSENKSPQEQYGAIKSFIMFMEEAQSICKSKGECFSKWFNDCVADQDYIDKYKRKMFYIENNIDKLTEEYNKKKYIEKHILPHLKDDLLNIIIENPDILQKDIYKMFEPDFKEYISQELYRMEKDFYIIREKCGNTYKLNIMQ